MICLYYYDTATQEFESESTQTDGSISRMSLEDDRITARADFNVPIKYTREQRKALKQASINHDEFMKSGLT